MLISVESIVRAKRAMTRERLAEFARTMVWVVPLTVLIWVYAEREQIARVNDLPLRIRIRTTNPSRVAILQYEKELTLDLEGPKIKLDALRQQLLQSSTGDALLIDYDPRNAMGLQTLQTADFLNNECPAFANSGVKVTAASPGTLTVMVEQVESKVLTVVAEANGAKLEAPPTFDPPNVRISGPRALLARLATKTIKADLTQSNALATPGPHELTDVPLILPSVYGNDPANSRLVVSPEKVKATFRVRPTDVTYTIPLLPVYALAPAGMIDQYQITFDSTITGVVVQGPPDLIAGIQNDSLSRRPKAILEYSAADLPPGRKITRKLRFELPDGLTIAPESANREVEFTLTPRATGTAAPQK
jgi:hypothetical protein